MSLPDRVRAIREKQAQARKHLDELEASLKAQPRWRDPTLWRFNIERRIASIRRKMAERERLLAELEVAVGKRVFIVKHSKEADKDHAESVRQYAYTVPGAQDDVIHVAMAWFDLPSGFQAGILAHEVGHHLAHPDGSEPAADEAFERATGYPIERRDAAEFGKNLEWISADAEHAMFKFFEFKGLEKI